MIRLEGVFKFYRADRHTKIVLDHVSADFQSGRSYALLGVNGAGKSITLRLISGVELPNSRRIRRTVIVEMSVRQIRIQKNIDQSQHVLVNCRSKPTWVFVFRYEPKSVAAAPSGHHFPNSLRVEQSFRIANHDLIYVSNSVSTEVYLDRSA